MSEVVRGRNDLWGALLLGLGVVLTVTAFAGVSLFQIGAVAFFVWLALARDKTWAWLPAAFFGFHVAGDLLDGRGGSLFFPLMVVAAGVLMLSKERLSKNATIGILLLLAVIGIASSNRDDPPNRAPDLSVTPQPAPEIEPPVDEAELIDLDLRGRDLVVVGREADVTIRRSSKSGGGLVPGEASVSEEGDVVTVDAGASDDEIELFVPAETQVFVRTVGGDVTAELSGVAIDVDTVSGDLDLDLVGMHAITAETAAGEIDAEGVEDSDPSPKALATEVVGSRVRLKTVTGSISISQT